MAAAPRWWGSLVDAAACCTKGVGAGSFSRYAPSDETEAFGEDAWGKQPQLQPHRQRQELQQQQQEALRSSMQDKVALYERALRRRNSYRLDRIDEDHDDESPPPEEQVRRKRRPPPKKNPCAVCHQEIYARDPSVRSFGKHLHAACFACRLCKNRLTGRDPLEVQFDLPNDDAPEHGEYDSDDDDDEAYAYEKTVLCLVCAPCQRDSALQGKARVSATIAGQRVEPSAEEQGDIEGVREAIGGELEDIVLAKMAPRCAVCGEDFLDYTGEIAMVGQSKYHKECWELGRPRNPSNNDDKDPDQRCLAPSQAARYLPDRWILRVRQRVPPRHPYPNPQQQQHDNTVIVATLFFVWATKHEDWKALRAAEAAGGGAPPLVFARDSEAGSRRAKATVEHHHDDDDGANFGGLSLELLPASHPLEGTLAAASVSALDDGAWCLSKHGRRHGVDHTLELVLPARTTAPSATELSLQEARLSLHLRAA